MKTKTSGAKSTPPKQLRIPNEPDKEDQKILAGKSKSYVFGWNKVKYSNKKPTGII